MDYNFRHRRNHVARSPRFSDPGARLFRVLLALSASRLAHCEIVHRPDEFGAAIAQNAPTPCADMRDLSSGPHPFKRAAGNVQETRRVISFEEFNGLGIVGGRCHGF
ncbi:MAG: hypothetical protein WAO89_04525 [Kiritimatiellia bacterium]|jgi:hypothetical protein